MNMYSRKYCTNVEFEQIALETPLGVYHFVSKSLYIDSHLKESVYSDKIQTVCKLRIANITLY